MESSPSSEGRTVGVFGDLMKRPKTSAYVRITVPKNTLFRVRNPLSLPICLDQTALRARSRHTAGHQGVVPVCLARWAGNPPVERGNGDAQFLRHIFGQNAAVEKLLCHLEFGRRHFGLAPTDAPLRSRRIESRPRSFDP